jgi:hypothetical protein
LIMILFSISHKDNKEHKNYSFAKSLCLPVNRQQQILCVPGCLCGIPT